MSDRASCPALWAVIAFGCVQQLVARADVADEAVRNLRAVDDDANAVPMYSWSNVEEHINAVREECINICHASDDCEEAARRIRALGQGTT